MTNIDPGAPEYEYDWQNPNKKTFDFGRVFSRAFSGVFANTKPLLIAIAIAIAFTIAMSFISTSQLKNIIGNGDIETAILTPGYWGWSIGVSIPAFFLTLWIQLIIVETAYAEFTKTPQPVSPLTSSLKYVLPMFVVALFYGFVSVLGFGGSNLSP
jgi:hypothetical protein